MTRSNPKATPGFAAQLAEDLRLASDCSTLGKLQQLAKRYSVQLRSNTSFMYAQKKITEHINELMTVAAQESHHSPQGSPAAVREPSSVYCNGLFEGAQLSSPVQGHRLSYSAVASPCTAPTASRLTLLGSVIKRDHSGLRLPSVAVQERSPLSGDLVGIPTRPASLGGQQAAASGEGQQGASSSSSTSTALEERVASLEGIAQQQAALIEAQAAQLAAQAAEIAAFRAQLATLRQQQQTSQATGISAAQGVSTLQGAVDRLQDKAAHGQRLEEAVGRLSSQQQKLAEQQELEECQRSVVLKVPQQLPASQPPAAAAEELLCTKLGVEVSVLRARPLPQREQQRGGEASSRTSYKVLLASGGERDAVLRAKAQRLKGTQISVDVLLTKQQQARRKALLPDAKRAAAAGQRVQWRYDRLYIDGKEHRGEGSLPESRSQQQGISAADGEGWQVVRSRRRQASTGEGSAPAASLEREEGEIPASPAGGTGSGQRSKRRQRQPKGADTQADSSAAPLKACQPQGGPRKASGKAAQQPDSSKAAKQPARDGAAQQQRSGGGGSHPPRLRSSPPRA